MSSPYYIVDAVDRHSQTGNPLRSEIILMMIASPNKHEWTKHTLKTQPVSISSASSCATHTSRNTEQARTYKYTSMEQASCTPAGFEIVDYANYLRKQVPI